MKSARIMFAYAGFLIACGLVAYFMAPAGANATTALIVPSVAAGLMIVFGAMASAFPRNRTVGMVGIHVGMVLPILFAAAFGYRAVNTFKGGDESKQYLAWILTVMATASLAAFVAILSARPAKQMRV
jgi:hypothetical protein